MTAGGEAFGSGARRDRDDEPATCDLPWRAVMVKAAMATHPLGTRQGSLGDRDGRRAKDMRIRRRRARAEMSLGFALASFPQASAVTYELEYAAALDSTARHTFFFLSLLHVEQGARNKTRKGVSD